MEKSGIPEECEMPDTDTAKKYLRPVSSEKCSDSTLDFIHEDKI